MKQRMGKETWFEQELDGLEAVTQRTLAAIRDGANATESDQVRQPDGAIQAT